MQQAQFGQWMEGKCTRKSNDLNETYKSIKNSPAKEAKSPTVNDKNNQIETGINMANIPNSNALKKIVNDTSYWVAPLLMIFFLPFFGMVKADFY